VLLRRFGATELVIYAEEIGLVFGVVSFIGAVMLLYGASNADAARVLSGAVFASLGAIIYRS
jgi:hypothetical protein